MNENIKDIIEILELAKEEIENNDENITVTLDLQDLKSLKNLYDLYNKELEKNTERINELINKVTLKQCELEKKDKIIDLMADNIADSSNVYENLINSEFQHTKEEVIEYFTKKAEENNG